MMLPSWSGCTTGNSPRLPPLRTRVPFRSGLVPRVAGVHSTWHLFSVPFRKFVPYLVLTACGGATLPSQTTSPSVDASTAADETPPAAKCVSMPDESTTPGACDVALAFVQCTYPSGSGCGCLSNDPTTCPGCGPSTGATCRSVCSANEYAVSCGGPPDPNFVYEDAPDACVGAAVTPFGNEYSCCPCE
jgi:hypothetical protein